MDRAKTKRSRRASSRKKYSQKCVPVTKKKVCGPSRKSCLYPNIYSRKNLIKEALDDEIVLDEFDAKKIPHLPTPQICSFLGLASKESIKFNRVIEQKICGPDPEPSNPKVWTKDQLLSYIKTHNILSLSEARKMARQDLCVLAADWSQKNKINTEFKLPHTSLDFYPVFKYKGRPSYIFPFIYELLIQYPDLCFFLREQKGNNGISYDCDKEEVYIDSNLIPKMKECNQRFFAALIGLTEKRENKTGHHSNLLLYDKKLNEIWHYEGLRKGVYHECNTQKLFNNIQELFRREINPKISFIDAPSYCPKLNLARAIFKQKHKGFNTEDLASGLCVIMNLWILNNKLNYPDLSLKEINERAIKALREHEYGMLNHILNWMNDRLETRKVLMKQASKVNMKFTDYMRNLIYAKQFSRYSESS